LPFRMVFGRMAGEHEPPVRRWTLVTLVTLAAIAVPCAPAAAATPQDEEALIVVRAAPGDNESKRERLREITAGAGLEPVRELPELGAVSVDLPAGTSVGELREEIGADGEIAVEPNIRLEPRLVPADPAYAESDPNAPGGDAYQWNLRRSGFERAWQRSRGGRAKVAVIDTGADLGHPDLGPSVDVAVDHDDSLLHGGAESDEVGHGTHVAGMACGESDNGFGIASAGFGCRMLVYKTDLSISSISESVIEATDRDADVINMSFGGEGSSQTLRNAVNRAYDNGVVLVAAAANDDTDDQGIPASFLQQTGTGPDIDAGIGLVVTAAEYDGSRAWFLPGRGSGISLAAYGAAGEGFRGIFSAWPGPVTEIETIELCGSCRGSFSGDDRFGYLEGTSMATPQVAGAAALIRSKRPKMTADRVIRLLKSHANRSAGYSDTLGWGILNANRSLRWALKKPKKRKKRLVRPLR